MAFPALFLSMSMMSGPAAMVHKLFDSFNRHDIAALQALYASNAHLTSSDFCRPRTGADVTRTYEALFRAFPDIRDDVETIIIEGNRVAVRFASASRMGKGLHLKLMTFLRFGGDLIIEDDTILDTRGQACEE